MRSKTRLTYILSDAPPCGIATAFSAEQVCVSIAMRLRWLSGYAEANKLGVTGSH